MRKRADQQLVDSGLVETRSRARDLIKRGLVLSHGKKVKKPSEQIDVTDLTIVGESHYVSRGFLKLKGICEQLNINFQEKIIGDFGASTGGFTQFALEQNASKVFCIDVGTDQLHQSLIENSKVVNLQNTNIKEMDDLDEKVDIAVIDLSFISLKLVLKKIKQQLKDGGEIIALVKPQFEVGKGNLDKKGLVKNDELVREALEKVFQEFVELGISVKHISKSTVVGKVGNQEYFFYGVLDESSSINKSILETL